jgi:death-on-curing protein
MTSAPAWIAVEVVLAIHEEQLAEHGGGAGIRDRGLLDSALARPRNAVGYGDPDLCNLAAAYAFGIARNHPFIDGNKRTAFVVCELFLAINGLILIADDSECVLTMLALAAGDLTENAFAEWLRDHTRPR